MAQCLHLCTCLAFSSWLQNGWGNSCHLIHVQGRKMGEKERLYQLHLFHFMRKQKLSQKIPPPPADFPHLIRPELTLRATHTWNKDGESIWLSSLYSREQQRWMIFTMASGQLIYSGFCKGTMTRFIYLESRVWEGEEWEIAGETDWGKVAEDSKGLNSTFSLLSQCKWLRSTLLPFLPVSPASSNSRLSLAESKTVEYPQGEEGRSGCQSPIPQ